MAQSRAGNGHRLDLGAVNRLAASSGPHGAAVRFKRGVCKVCSTVPGIEQCLMEVINVIIYNNIYYRLELGMNKKKKRGFCHQQQAVLQVAHFISHDKFSGPPE